MNGGLRGQTWGRESEQGAARGQERGCRGEARVAYSGGDAPPRLRKRGVPGLGKETTPRVPEPGRGCKGRRTLAAPKAGRGQRGRGGPAASAALSLGVSARNTPSPGPGRCYGHRRQVVTSPGLHRRTRPPPAGRGRGQRKGSSAAGPGNRLRLQRCSGTVTDPRGRHDGLRAAHNEARPRLWPRPQ